MFARKVVNGHDARQNRSNRIARPTSVPSFLRSDPDGKLLAMYQRVKAASAKPKLPTGRNRRERVKSQPVTERYAVGDNIKRPMTSKPMACNDFWKDIPPLPKLRDEATQDASTPDCEGVVEQFDKELEDADRAFDGEPNFHKFRCRKADVDSVFTAGLAEVEQSKTTVEVFEGFAKTFHNILERCTYAADTSDSATQTSTPKLQRAQLSLVYAGPWESCTLRQHRSTQTEEEDPKLTFAKQQPTAMVFQNSKQSSVNKLLGWKSFGVAFLVSAMFLGLMEIPNLF